MIGTLLRISWLNLKRDRVALGLTFVLPLVFFSIFAVIFGGMGGSRSGATSFKVIGVDLDGTEVSGKFLEALDGQEAIEIVNAPKPSDENPSPAAYDRETALHAVRTGKRSVAVIVPHGFGDSFGDFGGDTPRIELIHDPSNPLVQGIVGGLIQASAMAAAPDILLDGGIQQLETYGGALTPEQESAIAAFKVMLDEGESEAGDADGSDASGGLAGFGGLVEVQATSAMEEGGTREGNGPSIVSYYAAGIGVMFLLFSMAGAGAALLEEEESGTLERLLSSNVGMGTLIAGNWLFYSVVGFAQLSLMFGWAAFAFGLELLTPRRLAGFVLMSLITAAAAAAFGLLLATLSRSRAQLNGISTVVILVMSALGGSMVPRFAMPDFMNTTALFTFNGWALDGYLKIFWYEDPDATLAGALLSLAPQLTVLAAMAVVFFLVARVLARRWEAV